MSVYHLNQLKFRETFLSLENRYQTLLRDTVRVLMSTLAAKDAITGRHSLQVSKYSLVIGRALKLSHEELVHLELGALLHDIGKIGVPDRILMKRGPLTDEEFKIMRRHPMKSAQILSKVKALENIVPIVKYHQERIDGLGYPEGLRREQIPFLSRIVYIADAFDAMISDRPYRQALPEQKALDELATHAGSQFDPNLVKVFLRVFKKVKKHALVSEFFYSEERKKAIGQ